ncbi:7384_t:CDS:10 [Paraglomus brasilianum]|uniref:non-specific serine/threonine protein kinase n=1 Tax=Paraglomus brasilianum TaxID=144538 RepID=A0A9N9G4Z4_9GLOM|nr:7384_t:CDS:10 [Paraglomus brasilianum]
MLLCRYEVITTPTDIIMVMEYAGGELFNFIVERGKMSEEDARRFFQQIICAAEYCHRHKIAHRDLKPEKYSFLEDPYHNVKIADFGLSNIMTDGDFLKTSCGSPNYAAPEVISGKLYAGPEVDVWSCGVILYVMLCGRLPFDDEYIPTLFKKINDGIYTLPPFLSIETKYLLSSMLIVDPLKRITIAQLRENPWFNTGLPEYLKPLPVSEEDPFADIDEDIVSELRKALQESDNNQIKVAYQLVVDHKRMIDAGKMRELKNIQSFLASSPPSWNVMQPLSATSFANEELSAPSSIEVLSSSLPYQEEYSQNRRHPYRSFSEMSSRNFLPDKRTRTRSKWHFGIRSRNPPLEVMLEIYRALKNLGMDWKTIDPFHVRCRYCYENDLQVKVDVQLYKLNINHYLVDFKNVSYDGVDGKVVSEEEKTQNHNLGKEVTSLFPFFDVCTKLITELAIGG